MDPTWTGVPQTMSKLNRYQNPEIFERLAMSYASGTLHGRARLRFETLKKRHFYLEATSNAYESKFGSLVELLPNEKPSDSVWKSIEAQIQSETAVSEAPKTSWFGWLSNGYTFALLALLVTTFEIVQFFIFQVFVYLYSIVDFILFEDQVLVVDVLSNFDYEYIRLDDFGVVLVV